MELPPLPLPCPLPARGASGSCPTRCCGHSPSHCRGQPQWSTVGTGLGVCQERTTALSKVSHVLTTGLWTSWGREGREGGEAGRGRGGKTREGEASKIKEESAARLGAPWRTPWETQEEARTRSDQRWKRVRKRHQTGATGKESGERREWPMGQTAETAPEQRGVGARAPHLQDTGAVGAGGQQAGEGESRLETGLSRK